MKHNLVLGTTIVILAFSSISVNADDDLKNRCIAEAKSRGYLDGVCAYHFINECVTTRDLKAMDRWYKTSLMAGVVNFRGCTNAPSTYAAEFGKF